MMRAADVAMTIPSPGAFIAPPTLWHAERIPPPVLSAMRPAWETGWFVPRAIRILVFEDVFVAREGLAFTRDHEPIAATITQHAADEIHAAQAALNSGPPPPRLRGDVALCRKRGAGNYGHWLMEMLPSAWLIRRHWPGPVSLMVQAAPGRLGLVMRQSLSCLGDPVVLEIGPAPVQVDRLIVVDGLTQHGAYMSPLVMEALADMTRGTPPGPSQRLFVTRGSAVSRRFADEPELLIRAMAAGFAIVDPSSMPFQAQVAAFKGARRIVGAMGAAMANTVFAAPGAEVGLLAPASMSDTFFWFIGGLCGHDTVELRCRTVGPPLGPSPWDATILFDPVDRGLLLGPAWPASRRSTAAMEAALVRAFDPAHYLSANPDVAQAGVDALLHYLEHGWREGRNPSAAFDAERYLTAHPDVAAAGVNPLVHYVTRGAAEGRAIFPVRS